MSHRPAPRTWEGLTAFGRRGIPYFSDMWVIERYPEPCLTAARLARLIPDLFTEAATLWPYRLPHRAHHARGWQRFLQALTSHRLATPAVLAAMVDHAHWWSEHEPFMSSEVARAVVDAPRARRRRALLIKVAMMPRCAYAARTAALRLLTGHEFADTLVSFVESIGDPLYTANSLPGYTLVNAVDALEALIANLTRTQRAALTPDIALAMLSHENSSVRALGVEVTALLP